ncbi:MAG TPA: glyoxalase superfamily protein [Polyangia bacterium]
MHAAIRLGRLAPCVPVSDIGRAVGFYSSVFGMEKTFENGEPVGFVILKRDGAELHLTLVKDHVGKTQNVMHLMVEAGVEEVYRRCEAAAAARIIKRLRDAPWGLRTFVVADPDGNRIDVGQQIQPVSARHEGA